MKERNVKLAFYALLFAVLMAALHQPLPKNFTDSPLDKTVMYFMELVLRFGYVYPTRLCPDAYCQLVWTRSALKRFLAIVGPWSFSDPDVYIKDIDLAGIPGRIYVPYNRSNDGAIFYIHGGGFVLGNMNMYESLVRQVAKNARMVTFSLDYRLAPEHIFPAGLDDSERAVVHVLKYAYDEYLVNRDRIALMGDSAGAGLIASLTYRLRHRKDIPQPKIQVLIYPVVQLHNLRTPSFDYYYREMEGTALVIPKQVVQYYLMYAGVDVKLNEKITRLVLDNKHLSPKDRHPVEEYVDFELLPEHLKNGQNVTRWGQIYDEHASRLLGPLLQNPEFVPIVQPDLSGVPPALVVTTEFDFLRDEGVLYAARLRQAGIQTVWKHFSTGFHAMFNFHDTIKTSERALKYICDWTVAHV